MRFLRNDLVVSVRSELVGKGVEQSADKYADAGCDKEQRNVIVSEQQEKLMYDRQDCSKVDARKYDRNEEYREHLRVDTLFDIFFGHSDLLHDREP